MQETPLRPRKSELGWSFKPWYILLASMCAIAVLIFAFLQGRERGITGGTWLSFLAALLIGAAIGLIRIPAGLKYLDTHWRKGKHVYFERPEPKDSIKPFMPLLMVLLGLIYSLLIESRSPAFLWVLCCYFGYLLISDSMAKYLWWRSLPE